MLLGDFKPLFVKHAEHRARFIPHAPALNSHTPRHVKKREGDLQLRFGIDESVACPILMKKPRLSRFWLKMYQKYNQYHELPNRWNFQQIEFENLETIKTLYRKGARLLIVTNHPGNGDVALIYELSNRLKIPMTGMTAQCNFYINKPGKLFRYLEIPLRWFMLKIGLFPVHRASSGIGATRTMVNLLKSGPYPVVIFPEGRQTYQNATLQHFQSGAAYIAWRAKKQLVRKGNHETPVVIVPVTSQYRLLSDGQSLLNTHLTRLETQLKIMPEPQNSASPSSTPRQRIERVWDRQLALLEKAYDLPLNPDLTLASRHQQLMENMFSRMESQLGLSGPKHPEDAYNRIKRIKQRMFVQLFIGSASPIPVIKRRELFVHCFEPQLKRLFHLSKLNPDTLQKPGVALLQWFETAHSLEEVITPPGEQTTINQNTGDANILAQLPKKAIVKVGEPIVIDADAVQPGYQNYKSRRQILGTLTEKIRLAMQSTIEPDRSILGNRT